MNEHSKYSFNIKDGVDFKSRYLIYQEPHYKLLIYLESAGGLKYDWGAVDTSFNHWTEPRGLSISEDKKKEIFSRLADWSKKKEIRIHIGPPIDKEEMFKDYEKNGWKIKKLSDDSIRITPPLKNGIIKRFKDLLGWWK